MIHKNSVQVILVDKQMQMDVLFDTIILTQNQYYSNMLPHL